MKAVVLEVKNGKACVLKKNGEVLLIKQNELKEGDTIDIFGSTRGEGIVPIVKEGLKRLGALSMVSAVTMGGCFIIYNTAFTASYVSLDVNPALEFELNRWNRIIGISAVNDDALTIVQDLENKHLKGKPVNMAVKATGDVLRDNKYLGDKENYVLINVSSDDEAKIETLSASIEDALSEKSSTDLIYLINTGDLTDHKMALNLGISAGRYQEMRIVEARNSLGGAAAGDTERVKDKASEIQIDKSLAERYKDATVQDLFKGAGAIAGSYKAPELKRDDGKVSIRDLNINYETHSSDESLQSPDNGAFVSMQNGSIETESQGLDPIEEAAALNEALENSALIQENSTGNADTDDGGVNKENSDFGPSVGGTKTEASDSMEKGPAVPQVPSQDSSNVGPVPGSGSGNTTFGPQVPGN